MSRKSRKPNFEQILETLRTQGFTVEPSAEGGVLIHKHGAGAVLRTGEGANADDSPAAVFAVVPGALVAGQIARLLDRGYQKFLSTPKFEIPATASQLHAIHQFSEELKLVTGAIDLYNESLGTTSDLYQYDRLKGREAAQPAPHSPWQLADGH